MNLYDFNTYKEALKALMTEKREKFGGKFTFEKMAQNCGVQKTYFSKVMNSHAHLNPDQLFLSCEYLKLTTKESDFLLLLRETELTLNTKRAELLKIRIEKIRSENLKIKSELKTNPLASLENHKWEYFTNIDLQLVHLFLTIPSFAKKPELICEKIGIDRNKLMLTINKLIEWNLVQNKNGEYLAIDPSIHLPEESPAFQIFGILNRIKTIEKIRQTKTEATDDYFFSAIFSSELKLQNSLKKKILNLIKETQNDVIKQKSEQVYQLNIDFFKWS